MDIIKAIMSSKPLIIGMAGMFTGFIVGMVGGLGSGIWLANYMANEEELIEEYEAADRGDVD